MTDLRAGKTLVYIGVGSNIDPERNISLALELLARETVLVSVSTFYRSEALGRREQPEFLNGVCCVATALEPRALKNDVLRSIERQLGRVRSEDKYAPRTVDLDILLCGGEVHVEDDLCIPDPDIRTRPFVAVPLLELAPDAVLPDTGERLADLPVARPGQGLRVDMRLSEKLQERFQKNERQAR